MLRKLLFHGVVDYEWVFLINAGLCLTYNLKPKHVIWVAFVLSSQEYARKTYCCYVIWFDKCSNL